MRDELLSDAKAELVRLMKRRGEITVKDATTTLSWATSTIRQHLSALVADGFVATSRDKTGVGRPSHLYFLTEKAQLFFENREGYLLAQLIRSWVERGEKQKVEDFFTSISLDLASTWRRRISDAEEDQKLAVLEKILDDWGYVPECDYDEEGNLVITLCHCPYPNVVDLVPLSCRFEKKVLEEVTGRTLTMECYVPNGDPFCRFRSVAASVTGEAD